MSKLKGSSRVTWMSDEDIKLLQQVSDAVELPQTQVLTKILRAGLAACHDAGTRMPLPLKFYISEAQLDGRSGTSAPEDSAAKAKNRK